MTRTKKYAKLRDNIKEINETKKSLKDIEFDTILQFEKTNCEEMLNDFIDMVRLHKKGLVEIDFINFECQLEEFKEALVKEFN